MERRPKVSVITVNFNQLPVTCALLDSLRQISYPSVEVIVVDNGSSEDPSATIYDSYPEAIVVRSEANLGFAGGNNLGIRQATGDFFMFLNNDTEVDPGFLEPLVGLFETNPKAGAASSMLIYHNSGNVIQYAGSTCINPFTGRNKRIGYMEKDNGQYNTVVKTDLAHGAAMMVPRAVVEQVGMMPEFFFLYYEEIDWCESIKKSGYNIYFVPFSKVYHKESMSVGKSSTLKTYYMTRNRLLYMRRNTTGLTKVLWVLFYVTVSLPRNAFNYLLKEDRAHRKAFWKGLVWNITHLSNGKKARLFA